MIGYKAFNYDMTCRNFQYSIGKQYKMNEEPRICSQGFHFCKNLEDVFNYYPFDKSTRVCKIEAYGDIDTNDNIKFCTNKIKIQERINFDHLFQLRYKKGAISNSIDLSTIEIGTKIQIRNHTLICVSIQDNKYVFAFDEVVAALPFFKIHSFIHNLNNFKDRLSQEWLDNVSEVFIPNEYEIHDDYFWTSFNSETLLPFAYYKYKENRIKTMGRRSVNWWLLTDSITFAYVNSSGYIHCYDPSVAFGVVPHFIIKR